MKKNSIKIVVSSKPPWDSISYLLKQVPLKKKKKQTENNKCWQNWDPDALLVGMQNGKQWKTVGKLYGK